MKGKHLFLTVSLFLLISGILIVPIQARRPKKKVSFVIIIVKDPDGKPVNGATVEIYDSDNLVREGKTRRRGRYFTILPRGDYRVEASKDGFYAESDLKIKKCFKRVVLRLEPSEPSCHDVTIHVEENGGSSLSNAKVTIYDIWMNPITDTEKTGSDGNAYFCLSNGDYIAKAVFITWQTKSFTVSGAPIEVTITI